MTLKREACAAGGEAGVVAAASGRAGTALTMVDWGLRWTYEREWRRCCAADTLKYRGATDRVAPGDGPASRLCMLRERDVVAHR